MIRLLRQTILLATTLLTTTALWAAEMATPDQGQSDALLLSRATAAAAFQAGPAVVSLRVEWALPRARTEGGSRPNMLPIPGIGEHESSRSPYFLPHEVDSSGLIWSSRGEILTTRWNIGKAATSITVTLADGDTWPARLLGYDEVLDLALLQLEPGAGQQLPELPVLEHATVLPRVGQWVVALGRSRATEGPTATRGIISALGLRPAQDFITAIQHTAPVNFSNVGGPLVDLHGQLAGLTAYQHSDVRRNPVGQNSGVCFAVGVQDLVQAVERMRQGDRRPRAAPLPPPDPGTPYVGVRLEVDVGDRGIRVTQVVDGTAAHQAGLEVGDIILTWNGVSSRQIIELQRLIRSCQVDQTVPLRILRGSEEREMEITLGARPERQ